MKVKNVKVEEMSDKEFDGLMEKINQARGNFLLSKYSPKVI